MFGVKRLKKWWLAEHEIMYDNYRKLQERVEFIEDMMADKLYHEMLFRVRDELLDTPQKKENCKCHKKKGEKK
jgi:hypothetical protein